MLLWLLNCYVSLVAWASGILRGQAVILLKMQCSSMPFMHPQGKQVLYITRLHAVNAALIICCENIGKCSLICLHCIAGDTIQIVQDCRWVSFMYSYPNLIPLPAVEVIPYISRCMRDNSSA